MIVSRASFIKNVSFPISVSCCTSKDRFTVTPFVAFLYEIVFVPFWASMLSSFSEEKKILSCLFPFITISFVSMYISSMLSGTVYVLAFTFTVMLSIPVFDASSTTISSKLFTIYVSLPAPPIRVFGLKK